MPERVKPWSEHTDAERDRMELIMEIYAAVMDELDKSIGTLVDALRDREVLDNTLILFVSDNGGNAERGPMGVLDGGDWLGGPGSKVWCGMSWAWAQNTPFREFKSRVHEGGIATPLIAHWPNGIDASINGTWNRSVGHVIDIMATCVDISGATYPEQHNNKPVTPLQGVSLRPTFAGKDLKGDRTLYWEHQGNRAVRDGDWKLVAKTISGPWELYNLKDDRTESKNLAGQHPQRADQLAEKWKLGPSAHVFTRCRSSVPGKRRSRSSTYQLAQHLHDGYHHAQTTTRPDRPAADVSRHSRRDAAQHCLHHGGRHGLCRPRLLW